MEELVQNYRDNLTENELKGIINNPDMYEANEVEAASLVLSEKTNASTEPQNTYSQTLEDEIVMLFQLSRKNKAEIIQAIVERYGIPEQKAEPLVSTVLKQHLQQQNGTSPYGGSEKREQGNSIGSTIWTIIVVILLLFKLIRIFTR